MPDVVNKRINIYIDQSAGEAALLKLQADFDKTTQKIKNLEAAGKSTVAEMKKLDQVRDSIKKVQDQIDKGLAPSLAQQTTLVSKLRNELKRLSENDPQFATKLENFKRQNAELQRMQANVNGVTKSIESQQSGFAKVIGNIAQYAAGFFAVSAAVNFLSGSIDEAVQSEQNLSRLQNTLKNLGREDALKGLIDDADKLAEKFKYLDNDDIIGVFQKLITYGKLTQNQIQKLLPVIIDFAAQSQTSIADASETIIAALEGNSKGLKQYGINVKDGADATERLSIIMKELGPRVQGAGEAFSKTFSGTVATTQQDIANLEEEIGNKLLPVLKVFYQAISGAISGFEWIFKRIYLNFKLAYEYTSLTAGVLKDIATLDFAGASRRATQFAEDKKAKEEQQQQTKDIAAAQVAASNFASDAAKKTIEEQETILKQQEALQAGSAQRLNELIKAGKQGSDDFKRISRQLQQDSILVGALRDSINAQKDTRKLGIGDSPDKPGNDPGLNKAAAEAKANLLKLQQDFSTFEQKLKDTNAAFFSPQGPRAAALRQYFTDLKTLQENFSKGIIDTDQFDKDLKIIQSNYKLTIAKINADDQAKIQVPVEIVPPLPEDAGPTAEQMNAFLEKLKADNAFNFGDFMLGLFDKDKVVQTVSDITSFVADQFSIIDQFNQSKNNKENRQLDKELKSIDRQKAAYKSMLDSKLLSAGEYNKKIAALDQQADKKKEEIERKQFERQKRFNIAQILINAAAGAIKLWAEPGFPAAIPLAIALGVQTGLQVAAVASTKFALGGRPKGNSHERGGIGLIDSGTGHKVGEMEGDEGIIKKSAMQSGRRYTVTGTPSQIASTLNRTYGGIQWDSMAAIRPAYLNTPYRGIDYNGITKTYNLLRFAAGGVFSSSPVSNAQSAADSGISSQMIQAMAEQLNMNNAILAKLNSTLNSPLSVSLKKLNDAQTLDDRINEFGTLK